jgi:hydrogenase expression/formation protein HypD
MKYLDEFRNPQAASTLAESISTLARKLPAERSVNIMEVCGSHTMAIARYGIRDLLPANIRLISGPGCPVCVTAPGYIDAALELTAQGVIIASFGDMLKTPGSDSSLAAARSQGARIEVCYSPLTALDLARDNPESPVVFLAIGFETTIAPTVALIELASARGIGNLALLTAYKLVPPVLEVLCADPELGLDAFLCPAHVSAIIGSEAYRPLAEKHRLPCVVAGFEPLDILLGIEGVLKQILAGEARVDNQYSRIVRPQGNRRAQELIARHLENGDADWRGLGRIPGSGLRLRPEFAAFDAAEKFAVAVAPGREPPGCLCGEVLKGKCAPTDCPLFGDPCNPDTPIGPCMVSQEGSCAAAYKF